MTPRWVAVGWLTSMVRTARRIGLVRAPRVVNETAVRAFNMVRTRNALGRTGDDHATGRTALADELVELAQEGPGGWQKLVENLVNSQE